MLTQRFLVSLLPVLAAADALHPALLAARGGVELLNRQADATPTGADPSETGSGSAKDCASAILSVVTSVPSPPPEYLSWAATVSVTDPCHFSIPSSLSSAFKSYESEAVSWYSAHSSELSSALSQCPQYSSVASGGAIPTNFCTGGGGGAGLTSSDAGTSGTMTTEAGTETTGSAETTVAAGSSGAAGTTGGAETTGASGSKTSSGASGSKTSSASSTSATPNAGHRENGLVGAVVAAVGFVGVVAAL
ncbi:hypothetical protein DL546_007655 [Coniochaeta pulveracea]|uniref:DUF7735 domain-containing protein n=1 Tax=Coniochaeta pulveracea TaxID=177199 RepID=A0A420YLU9_9PEZI|nr:hypothetical protein DL546_007655 [Coniochaeta pulveracea]